VKSLADHITALTESFDSKLADAGNPLVRQLGRYLIWPRVAPAAEVRTESDEVQQTNRGHCLSVAMSTKRIVPGTHKPSTFRMP
jgi:hypothetical protein